MGIKYIEKVASINLQAFGENIIKILLHIIKFLFVVCLSLKLINSLIHNNIISSHILWIGI